MVAPLHTPSNSSLDGFAQQVAALSWSRDDALRSLALLYEFVSAVAERNIQWYDRKRAGKKRWSSALRACAIAFAAVGSVAPLLAATGAAFAAGLAQWGYVALAGAGACIGADRAFGFSSGWIRYMITQLALEKALTDFRFSWALEMATLEG